MIDPTVATLRARVAAYSMHAKHDPRETTVAARTAFQSKFVKLVEPDGFLPLEERLRRADCARKAHFARMALLSSQARAKKSKACAGGSV